MVLGSPAAVLSPAHSKVHRKGEATPGLAGRSACTLSALGVHQPSAVCDERLPPTHCSPSCPSWARSTRGALPAAPARGSPPTCRQEARAARGAGHIGSPGPRPAPSPRPRRLWRCTATAPQAPRPRAGSRAGGRRQALARGGRHSETAAHSILRSHLPARPPPEDISRKRRRGAQGSGWERETRARADRPSPHPAGRGYEKRTAGRAPSPPRRERHPGLPPLAPRAGSASRRAEGGARSPGLGVCAPPRAGGEARRSSACDSPGFSCPRPALGKSLPGRRRIQETGPTVGRRDRHGAARPGLSSRYEHTRPSQKAEEPGRWRTPVSAEL
ncbi:PREDICTED: translation initiation factor IF-2-like [Chinchilla lanigera]|uniref:translation initiation factor IF-2-like n=1 Tax=Chinchilla lanigera TaxID=34839 RepID=UPI00069872D8|nr:PREDICTED: translation initiation factor IF-2-like [Chinchilla lanigera]